MSNYTGLDEDICHTAWEMILPSVKQAASMEVTNKLAGTITVYVDDNQGFMGIMFADSVDKDHPNALKYDQIADAKARVSFRTGLSSRQVQQESPHLYQEGDTKWGGSVVRNGLVVAFSGVQAVFDEMIAGWMADTIIALCRNEMTKPDGVMANESLFLEN